MTDDMPTRKRPGGGEGDLRRHRPVHLRPSDDECRGALRAVLESETLSSSRRIRDFIAYAGQAFLDGREDLDQYEIAVRVLQRQGEFNPVEDASVRKLASQTRDKLEKFYAEEGIAEPVVALLPSRSYVLRFRYRDETPEAVAPEAVTEPAASPAASSVRPAVSAPAAPLHAGRPRRILPFVAAALAGGLPFLAVLLWHLARDSKNVTPRAVRGGIGIMTRRGDLRGPLNEIAAGAVRLGPGVGQIDEVTASLHFEPSQPTQQAGIMLFGNPDDFVRLGYQFKMRTMIEMGIERQGRFQDQFVTYEFDPVTLRAPFSWFTLRREAGRLLGFVSRDGCEWRPVGTPIEDQGLPAVLRAAVYAFDGRSENRSTEALFRHFAVGMSFHNRKEGVVDLRQWAPRWTVRTDCPENVEARIARGALEVANRHGTVDCSWELTRAAPEGDWSFSAFLDFMPVSGDSAGLLVSGERGKATLSRRALSGGSILLEQPGDDDFRAEDFPGWPMITLRLVQTGGRLRGSFSRDGEHFVQIPGEVSLDRIGKPLRVGIVNMEPKWGSGQPPSAPRFYRMQQDIESPAPYR